MNDERAFPGGETRDVVIVGAGQAGLALGSFLRRAGLDFALLDAHPRIGDAWRRRYDSLRLFTPAKRDALPGLPFPGGPERYPTKDEVADYLEVYARTFELPVLTNTRVARLEQDGEEFALHTSRGLLRARRVVIAAGPFGSPFVPPFARDLDESVVHVHSAAYRRPAQLPEGRVVVVGSGNSGAQIAEELSASRRVTVALGRPQPALPQRLLGRDVFDVLSPLGLFDVPAASRLGRQLQKRDPVIGTNLRSLARRGRLDLAPRIVGAEGRALITENGRRLEADAIVWATGFRPALEWIKLPMLDEAGRPAHQGGLTAVPGAFFLGLSWQRTRASALLGGVGRDAAWLARILTRDAIARPEWVAVPAVH